MKNRSHPNGALFLVAIAAGSIRRCGLKAVEVSELAHDTGNRGNN